jgi:hypothetical protein
MLRETLANVRGLPPNLSHGIALRRGPQVGGRAAQQTNGQQARTPVDVLAEAVAAYVWT